MTLVVSLVTGSMIVQVGDRLLTRAGVSWDPLANKTVLVLARDGYASISYSGLAHIRGTPTDQWLAEAASGHATRLGPSGGAAALFSGGVVPSMGLSMAKIREALKRDFGSLPARDVSLGLSVLTSGFVVRRRPYQAPRRRPFMDICTADRVASGRVTVTSLPRYWEWNASMRLASVGVMAVHEKGQVIEALQSPGHRNEDDLERLLLDCVVAVSNRDQTVGPNAMSVVISRKGHVRVRFMPHPQNG